MTNEKAHRCWNIDRPEGIHGTMNLLQSTITRRIGQTRHDRYLREAISKGLTVPQMAEELRMTTAQVYEEITRRGFVDAYASAQALIGSGEGRYFTCRACGAYPAYYQLLIVPRPNGKGEMLCCPCGDRKGLVELINCDNCGTPHYEDEFVDDRCPDCEEE
jgi:hypothetical protein